MIDSNYPSFYDYSYIFVQVVAFQMLKALIQLGCRLDFTQSLCDFGYMGDICSSSMEINLSCIEIECFGFGINTLQLKLHEHFHKKKTFFFLVFLIVALFLEN